MIVTARIGSTQRRHQGIFRPGREPALAVACCSGFDVGVLEAMVKAWDRGCPHGSHRLGVRVRGLLIAIPMTMHTMALTKDNVEKVLDEVRPFLLADGGNVEVVELDGPIVKVRLQGACGSCPSSTMTLKMGIERKLREMIPEISDVVQVL